MELYSGTMKSLIYQPLLILTSWTMVMWLWMYITRLPAIFKAKMVLDPNAPRGQQMSELPARVRWKADNYNHLFEQPTIFYATGIILGVTGQGEGLALTFAWSYVGLRIVHSLIQSLWNKIEVRFVLFVMSSLPLIGMIWIAVSNST